MNLLCNTFCKISRWCPSPNSFLCFASPICVPKKLTICDNVCEPCPQKKGFQKPSSFPPLSTLGNASDIAGNRKKAKSLAKSDYGISGTEKLRRKVGSKKPNSKNYDTREGNIQQSQRQIETQKSNRPSKRKIFSKKSTDRAQSGGIFKNKDDSNNAQGRYLNGSKTPTRIPSVVDHLAKDPSSRLQIVPGIDGKNDLNAASKEVENSARKSDSSSREIENGAKNLKSKNEAINHKTGIGTFKNMDSIPQNGRSRLSSPGGDQIKNLEQTSLAPCHANDVPRKQKKFFAGHQSCTARHSPRASIYRFPNPRCISPNSCQLTAPSKYFPDGEIGTEVQVPLWSSSFANYKVCKTCGTVKLNLGGIRQKCNPTPCFCIHVLQKGTKMSKP